MNAWLSVRANFILLATLMISGPPARAQETATPFKPNILKGNWAVGGAVDFVRGPNDGLAPLGQFSFFAVASSIEYFVAEGIAVGGRFSYGRISQSSSSSGSEDLGFGPSASYFFWTSDRFAARLQGSFLRRTSQDKSSILEDSRESSYGGWVARVGAQFGYFLLPSVSVGPSIGYSRYWGSLFRAPDGLDSSLAFSIFL
ncbi:MAG: hypothetical protein ACK5QT_04910 [Oligoflexia bacterium]